MKQRPTLAIVVIALIALFIGVAGAAAALAYIPAPGSAPSIYDDFNFSSTSNGFWHVNADGATATIKNGILRLAGNSIELDRRIQTDPYETVAVARISGSQYHKFGMGLGIYHSGTLGLEFDDDGIKCGRGTDSGYAVDWVKKWKPAPVGQWFYIEMSVKNPYPTQRSQDRVKGLDYEKLKKVTLTCSAYDANGRLLSRVVPKDPAPNAHYAALDEAYMRTWDAKNDYHVDWFYAGPPSGNPLNRLTTGVAR
ncbi:MAG: hypothetical protein NVSMB52_16510 [Chloroflexota bacterium]